MIWMLREGSFVLNRVKINWLDQEVYLLNRLGFRISIQIMGKSRIENVPLQNPCHISQPITSPTDYPIAFLSSTRAYVFQIVNFNNVTFQPLSADQVVAKGARPASQSAPRDLLQLIPEVRAYGLGAS